MKPRTIQIPKGNGRFRTIYVLPRYKREELAKRVPALAELALQECPAGVVHGFWPGRSAVTNAEVHVGYAYTVSFDLEDFFDSCTAANRPPCLDPLADEILFDGALRQGPPTSPPAANVYFARADHDLLALAREHEAVYTRYADDLTFSANSPEAIRAIRQAVPAIVERYGFRLNAKKTREQWSGAGRRVICGVAVDAEGVHPTRASKRKLRAARHRLAKARTPLQYNHAWNRTAGLAQWVATKPPGVGRKARHAMYGEPAQEQLRIALDVARFQ